MDTSNALKSLTALSHENRLAIFRLLVEQGTTGIAAGQIAEGLGLPAATASFHLKELVNAELAVAEPQSRFIFYRANYGTMNGLIEYLTDNCCVRGGICLTECAPPCATAANTVDADAPARSRRAGKSSKRRAA
jgi:DNA-binding transcriptional ArsR family regulator